MIQAEHKRVIFLPFIEAFGGSERLVLDLSRFLHGEEIPHVLACFRNTIDLQSYADWPLPLHQIRPKRNSLSEARSLRDFLKLNDRSRAESPLLFDLKSAFYSGILSDRSFFLHLTDPPSLLPSDISKYAGSARRQLPEFGTLPKTTITRGLRGELVHRFNQRGMRRASKIIVMTDKIRNELRHLYGVDSLVVRPGVSSKNGFACDPRWTSSDSLRILSVSRLEPSKRIDWILHAMAAIKSKYSTIQPGWRLEIVGEGPAGESLKKLATELGLLDRTSFLGHVSNDELASAYSRASLFLMPAAQGYGLPALEALDRKIPTVVHKDSGVSEILRGNPWVEIVDGDSEDLTKAIEIMMDRLNSKNVLTSAAPSIPKSSVWAQTVCSVCEWV